MSSKAPCVLAALWKLSMTLKRMLQRLSLPKYKTVANTLLVSLLNQAHYYQCFRNLNYLLVYSYKGIMIQLNGAYRLRSTILQYYCVVYNKLWACCKSPLKVNTYNKPQRNRVNDLYILTYILTQYVQIINFISLDNRVLNTLTQLVSSCKNQCR